MSRPALLPVEEALARSLALPLSLAAEIVPCGAALGRHLAAPLVARLASPLWDNAAMDGIAVRSADLVGPSRHPGGAGCDDPVAPPLDTVQLRIIATVAAGHPVTTPLVPGTCARIMTGAPLPPGADAVVMREHLHAVPGEPDRVAVPTGTAAGRHVRRAGEEFGVGDRLLPAGTRIHGGTLGLLAAQGHTTVRVHRRPRVAILATGDELVAPGQALGPGQIHASNTAALAGLVAEAGGEPVDCGVAPDTLSGTRAALERALAAAPDLLLTTGGVSVGDFDHVRTAMGEAGMDLAFYKVRMKPGKPLAVGTIGGIPTFGLPGNPVSSQVCFLEFVRPLLLQALGEARPFLPVVDAVLTHPLRRRAGRSEFLRVALDRSGPTLRATSLTLHSSGQVGAMARIDGLAMLHHEATHVDAGDTLPVQLLGAGRQGQAAPGLRWGGRWD